VTPAGNDALDRAGRVASEPSAFDADTRVEPVGEGVWDAEITPRWSVVGGAPNGGYLVAIALNGLARDVGRPHPLTATAHFLQRPEVGPVQVRTTVEREGRHATGTARLIRDETSFLLLTATFGNLDEARGPRLAAAEPPDLPPMDQCLAPPPGMDLPPIAHRFDFRLDPASVGWAVGQPGVEASMGGYVRFADGRPADVASLPAWRGLQTRVPVQQHGLSVRYEDVLRRDVAVRHHQRPSHLSSPVDQCVDGREK
jgi:hypothetical protein